jgi:hypothetical protein
VGTGTLA